MTDLTLEVDRLTRRLLHTSRHNKCVAWLGGRIQDDVNELRRAAGLPEFGWNDAVPDEEVGRCTVHPEDCAGQHTHTPPVPFNADPTGSDSEVLPADEHHFDVSCDDRPYCEIQEHHALEDMS